MNLVIHILKEPMIKPTSVFMAITKTIQPKPSPVPTWTTAPTEFMIPTLSYTINDMKEWANSIQIILTYITICSSNIICFSILSCG